MINYTTQLDTNRHGNNKQLIAIHANSMCKSCKPENGLRTETCSGSNHEKDCCDDSIIVKLIT
jgi:hypothetical protein